MRCEKNVQRLGFEDTPVMHAVAPGILDEASGLANSGTVPGCLWVNEDSQTPTQIHLLEYTGKYRKKVFIKDVTNRDWEEIALSDGPSAGKNYLYIGETGDNNQIFTEYIIYRFQEPPATADTVYQVDKLRFNYPDGSHDSEAFFVDAITKDIYIITKRDAKSKVYKLTYPQSTTSVTTASFVMDLPYTGVVAASFSSRTQELLIKTYTEIFYYVRNTESIAELLGKSYTKLSYQPEPQGEAICFADERSGFFTLSEKAFAPSVSLNFYRRK